MWYAACLNLLVCSQPWQLISFSGSMVYSIWYAVCLDCGLPVIAASQFAGSKIYVVCGLPGFVNMRSALAANQFSGSMVYSILYAVCLDCGQPLQLLRLWVQSYMWYAVCLDFQCAVSPSSFLAYISMLYDGMRFARIF